MEELTGWKPFRNVDPSMTETTLDNAVESMESWLRDIQKLKEGLDYVKRSAGAWTEFHVREECYDALVPWYRFELWFDLTNDSYVLTGLDNEYKSAWTFGTKGRMRDFNPDALRRAGH